MRKQFLLVAMCLCRALSTSIGGATAWTKVDESFTVKLYPFK